MRNYVWHVVVALLQTHRVHSYFDIPVHIACSSVPSMEDHRAKGRNHSAELHDVLQEVHWNAADTQSNILAFAQHNNPRKFCGNLLSVVVVVFVLHCFYHLPCQICRHFSCIHYSCCCSRDSTKNAPFCKLHTRLSRVSPKKETRQVVHDSQSVP